jgi:integrase
VFYFLFYFDLMHANVTTRTSQIVVSVANLEHRAKHRSRFNSVKDSRNRKVRGLWRRGEKLYMQTRVAGEKSARKIPLDSTGLEAARAEMADIRKKNRGEGLPNTGLRPFFADYARKYLEFQRTARDSGKKPRTIAREDHSLVHWIAAIGNVRLDKITKPMITGFVKTRLEKGLKPRTVNIDVIVLRNVLKEARDDGLIVNLPTEGIKPKKVNTPVRSVLSPAAFESLCKAAAKCGKNSVQLCDYIRLLAYSGARRDEALALKWEDVNFERKFLRIGADGLAKNSKARHVDFNAELEAHLKDMVTRRVPDSQWVFPSPQRGESDKPAKTLRESFLIAREKAELECVGFHDLRHYFASMAVMSGIDFKTIAEWLGHQDGGMLVGKVYGHLLPEHRQRMAERLVFTPVVVRTSHDKQGVPAAGRVA